MPTVIFDDPIRQGFYGGLLDHYNEVRRRNEEKHIAEEKKRRKRQKTAAIVGTAAAGAATGGLAAAALAPAAAGAAVGVGGAAGASGVGSGAFVGSALSGAAGPVAAGTTTAGLAAGGGGLLAGLTPGVLTGTIYGAKVGAGLGDLIATGEPESFQRALTETGDRVFRGDQLAQGRAFETSERLGRQGFAAGMERLRTDENVRQARDVASIETYGVPYDQAVSQGLISYQDAVGGGPMAGEELPTQVPQERQYAFGPGAMGPAAGRPGGPAGPPGQQPPPPLEPNWGPAQLHALSDIERRRAETVDNPEWIRSNPPELRELERQALDRMRSEIRPGLAPAKPRPMMVGPGGQPVPMQQGVNPFTEPLPYGAMYLDAKGGQHFIQPTKQQEARDTPFAYEAADGTSWSQTAGSTKEIKPDVFRTVDANGNVEITDLRSDKDGASNYRKRAAQLVKPEGGSGQPAVGPAEAVAADDQQKEAAFLLEINDLNPETISEDDYRELGRRITDAYGRAVPDTVMDAYIALRPE